MTSNPQPEDLQSLRDKSSTAYCNRSKETFLTLADTPSHAPSGVEWTTDPVRLLFTDYRDRLIWGPPDATGSRQCIDRKLLREPFSYRVVQKVNPYASRGNDDYGAWTNALEAGRSYLVGSSAPMKQFLRTYTSSMIAWQRQAFVWCMANPTQQLVLTAQVQTLIYHIMRRGEYVEIGLPHQDHGGEKHWISLNGRTKVLVNVD